MSDPWLIMMIQDEWPELPIHLSVQANAVNYKTVEYWHRQGLMRTILSRELSLDEIAEIREKVPAMELEVFVHGALCMAYSGRCLLSGYMNHRDPNQGTCTNACRWNYQVHEAKETAEGDIIALDSQSIQKEEVVLLQERNRPGEYMPAFEDEHGTYIMNSKDLRAIELVEQLVKMGVHSLKIEGRTKSHFYVARTVQAYRKAIDLAVAGKPFDSSLLGMLDSLAHRGYTEGFYRRHKPQYQQNYETGSSVSLHQQFVAEIFDYTLGDEWLNLEVKNQFNVGDSMELMTPQGNIHFELAAMTSIKGEAMQRAPGSGHKVRIPVAKEMDCSFGLLMRTLAEA